MPKLPRLTAQEAEKLLFDASFVMIRSKGSHRVYLEENIKVAPFHAGRILHPKVVKQIIKAIGTAE